jgi:hypothetical protein
MKIPPEVSIPLCIEQGSIYLYEFQATRRDGTEYIGQRFFVVLNVNPKTDEILVLTTITKQIEKQERFIQTVREDTDTLVRISPADFARLSVESVVNCNNTHELTLRQLIEKVEDGGKIFYEKLPKNIMDAIVRGVLKSNLVPAEHKKLLI